MRLLTNEVVLLKGLLLRQAILRFPKHVNLQNGDERNQMGRGFSRHRNVKFHPSVQNRSVLQLIYHILQLTIKVPLLQIRSQVQICLILVTALIGYHLPPDQHIY
jgi:hypothetical protein